MFIKICLTFYLQTVFILSIEFCHLHSLLDSDISVIIWLRNYSYILPAEAYYVNKYFLFFSLLCLIFTFHVETDSILCLFHIFSHHPKRTGSPTLKRTTCRIPWFSCFNILRYILRYIPLNLLNNVPCSDSY